MMSPALLAAAVAGALQTHHATLVPEADIRPVAQCVAQITGLPLPNPLPTVMRSTQWSFTPRNDCCNRGDGQRITGATTMTQSGAQANRVLAFYAWRSRFIVLAASAMPQQLAHELANDFATQAAATPLGPRERGQLDLWAYDIEARYHVSECAQ